MLPREQSDKGRGGAHSCVMGRERNLESALTYQAVKETAGDL